jgi:hypothetical protein
MKVKTMADLKRGDCVSIKVPIFTSEIFGKVSSMKFDGKETIHVVSTFSDFFFRNDAELNSVDIETIDKGHPMYDECSKMGGPLMDILGFFSDMGVK